MQRKSVSNTCRLLPMISCHHKLQSFRRAQEIECIKTLYVFLAFCWVSISRSLYTVLLIWLTFLHVSASPSMLPSIFLSACRNSKHRQQDTAGPHHLYKPYMHDSNLFFQIHSSKTWTWRPLHQTSARHWTLAGRVCVCVCVTPC